MLFISGVSMADNEVRAASLMLLQYLQEFPQWLDSDASRDAYALPSSMLRIAVSYELGTFFPAVLAAVVVAGGWAQMGVGPRTTMMMGAMWKHAFMASEHPRILVGFVIAAQVALGVTLVIAANSRR